jgi:hypothetical protein
MNSLPREARLYQQGRNKGGKLMASGVFEMLAALASDPQKLADFKNDPDSVMNEYNLSTDQKKHIKSSLNDGKHHDFFKVIGDEVHDQFTDPDILIC